MILLLSVSASLVFFMKNNYLEKLVQFVLFLIPAARSAAPAPQRGRTSDRPEFLRFLSGGIAVPEKAKYCADG